MDAKILSKDLGWLNACQIFLNFFWIFLPTEKYLKVDLKGGKL